MSKEKQIEEMAEALRKCSCVYTDCDHRCSCCKNEELYDDTLLYIAQTLYNAGYRKQSENVTDINVGSKSEWISVEERLPEENGRYLVCVNISHLAFENLTAIAIMAYGISHGFYLYNENEKVTHWMPLPEAPKRRKEDEGK